MKYIAISLLSVLLLLGCKKDKTSLFNTWKLKSYLGGPGQTVVNSGFNFTISFSKDSTYNAQLDINSCSGMFYKSSSEFTILGGNCTETCCDSLKSKEVWSLFLDSITSYEISGEQLKLRGENYINLDFSLVE